MFRTSSFIYNFEPSLTLFQSRWDHLHQLAQFSFTHARLAKHNLRLFNRPNPTIRRDLVRYDVSHVGRGTAEGQRCIRRGGENFVCCGVACVYHRGLCRAWDSESQCSHQRPAMMTDHLGILATMDSAWVPAPICIYIDDF